MEARRDGQKETKSKAETYLETEIKREAQRGRAYVLWEGFSYRPRKSLGAQGLVTEAPGH